MRGAIFLPQNKAQKQFWYTATMTTAKDLLEAFTADPEGQHLYDPALIIEGLRGCDLITQDEADTMSRNASEEYGQVEFVEQETPDNIVVYGDNGNFSVPTDLPVK